MLADGADAVVMVENTQVVDDTTIEVVRPVAPGENVLQVGDDVKTGQLLLPSGHLLRPQDIGGLMGLGINRITVSRRPRVSILSTGDELVSAGAGVGAWEDTGHQHLQPVFHSPADGSCPAHDGHSRGQL